MIHQYYYADAANKRIGPMPWEVLEQLHRAGTLTDQTLVTSEVDGSWVSFVDAKSKKEEQSQLPPVPVREKSADSSENRSSSKRKRTRVKKKSELPPYAITKVIIVCGVTLLIVAGILLIYLRSNTKVINPNHLDLSEVGDLIEAMPPIHLPHPDSPVEDPDYLRMVTGEDSALVSAIPDHPGRYQIEVTRYGGIYGMLGRPRFHRDLLTVLLTLAAEYKRGRWVLLEGKGSEHHSISRPGDLSPEVTIVENIPTDEVIWHGQFIVQYLNGEPLNAPIEALSASKFAGLQSRFEKERLLRDELRARGMPQP